MPSSYTRRAARSRVKGLFADGVWQCDCDPRLPADHFRVKKDGKNHGKWFYTCQRPEAERCGFFLWAEEAQPREANAVLNNSRNEPRSTPNVQNNGHDFRALNENPKLGSGAVSRYSRSPEKGPQFSMTDTLQPSLPPRQSSFYGDSLDDETLASADTTPLNLNKKLVVSNPISPMTPVKRKLDEVYTNSGTGLVTPQTGGDVSRIRTSNWTGGTSNNTTPTPARFRDAMESSADDELYKSIETAADTQNVRLTPDFKSTLRTLCVQTSLRIQGVVKGREIARLSLKAKDAKITELEHRVATLQAELELQKALVRHRHYEGGDEI